MQSEGKTGQCSCLYMRSFRKEQHDAYFYPTNRVRCHRARRKKRSTLPEKVSGMSLRDPFGATCAVGFYEILDIHQFHKLRWQRAVEIEVIRDTPEPKIPSSFAWSEPMGRVSRSRWANAKAKAD